MKQEVKVSFYTKRNETREDGKCPVMARLTVGATEVVFSAKLTVPVGMWASGRAKGKSQTANEINRRLDEIRASALSHRRELSAIREKVTAEEVNSIICICEKLFSATVLQIVINILHLHYENSCPNRPVR